MSEEKQKKIIALYHQEINDLEEKRQVFLGQIANEEISISKLEKEVKTLTEKKKKLSFEVAGLNKNTRSNPGKAKIAWIAFFSLLIISVTLVSYLLLNQTDIKKSNLPGKPENDTPVDSSLYGIVNYKQFDIYGQHFKYTGKTLNGMPEGEGNAFFDNGDTYIGGFKNGYREGKGKYHFFKGDLLDGNFRKNDADGIGKYIFKDGSYYYGEFSGSLFNGQGILFSADGSIAEQGLFKDGKLITK